MKNKCLIIYIYAVMQKNPTHHYYYFIDHLIHLHTLFHNEAHTCLDHAHVYF